MDEFDFTSGDSPDHDQANRNLAGAETRVLLRRNEGNPSLVAASVEL